MSQERLIRFCGVVAVLMGVVGCSSVAKTTDRRLADTGGEVGDRPAQSRKLSVDLTKKLEISCVSDKKTRFKMKSAKAEVHHRIYDSELSKDVDRTQRFHIFDQDLIDNGTAPEFSRLEFSGTAFSFVSEGAWKENDHADYPNQLFIAAHPMMGSHEGQTLLSIVMISDYADGNTLDVSFVCDSFQHNGASL